MREGPRITLLFAVTMAIGLGGVALTNLSGHFTSLDDVAVLFVLGTPFLFLLLYLFHGREKDETVPPYLSEVPNPSRKPWVVNLVFRSDTFESTDDAFYATVLDLQRRGYVALDQEPGGWVRIRILRNTSDDPFEREVLRFLGIIGEAKMFDPEEVGRLIFSTLQSNAAFVELATGALVQVIRGAGRSHMFAIGSLMKPPEDVVGTLFDEGRSRVFPVVLAAAVFYLLATFLPVLSGVQGMPSIPIGIIIPLIAFTNFLVVVKGQRVRGGVARSRHMLPYLFLGFLFAVIVLPATLVGVISPAQMPMYVVGFQCLAATLVPPALLGKWKADAYREKLQWDAFRAFLSDMVKIRGYSHADRSM